MTTGITLKDDSLYTTVAARLGPDAEVVALLNLMRGWNAEYPQGCPFTVQAFEEGGVKVFALTPTVPFQMNEQCWFPRRTEPVRQIISIEN